jgi:vancomycin permeability regulator SanA
MQQQLEVNAAAVRGLGLMMGADPSDMYEQRMMGAKQLYDQQKLAEGLGSMI